MLAVSLAAVGLILMFASFVFIETGECLKMMLAGVATIFVGLAIGVAEDAYSPPSSADITRLYRLPPELSGCKVFRLRGNGFARTLYVVARDGHAEATAWSEQEGKTTRQLMVVTPEEQQ